MTESVSGSAPSSKPASERTIPAAASNDKRQFPRFKVEGAIAVLGKPGFLASLGLGRRGSQVVNLSQGGAMVRLGKRLPVDSRNDLRIEIPKYQEVIEAVGEIRWCLHSAKRESDIYVGIRFVDLPSAEQRKLARMVDLFTSTEYKALAAVRREASSIHLRPPRL